MGVKLKIIIEFAKIVIQLFYLKIAIDMPSPLSKGAHILNPEVAGSSQLTLKKWKNQEIKIDLLLLLYGKYHLNLLDMQEVSREFKTTLEREIGLDDPQPSTMNTSKSSPSNVNENPQAKIDPSEYLFLFICLNSLASRIMEDFLFFAQIKVTKNE